MGFRGRLAIAGVVAALALPTAALAQKPDEKAKRQARKLIKSGDAKFQRGERFSERGKDEQAKQAYEEALAEYQNAFDTYPGPKIYFPIAQAEEKLGRWMDAYRHYSQLLEEAEDLNDQVRETVKARMNRVKKNLSALKFKVEPDGATVKVDGNEIGTAPLAEPFWVEPGEHSFAITSDGYSPQEGTADLAAGDVLEEEITLEPVPTMPKLRKKKKVAPAPVIDKPEASKLPLWIGLGATGALAAATTLTGVLAVKKHGTFTDETITDPDVREAARSSGRKLAFTTDALLLATLASGAFTAYYYYGIYRPKQARLEQEQEQGPSTEKALWITPYAESDGGGFAIGGSF